MRRIIGPILGVLGILLIFGLVAGIAYSAGLAAAGVVVAPGTTTTVVPVVGYAWYGGPWFGFGHFLAFLFVIVLIVALLRAAFGVGRRWGGPGWGYGPGYGRGYGRGRHGWDHDHGVAGSGGAGTPPGGPVDPREAWIRARLDEWHRTAHAGPDPATPTDPTGGAQDGPTPPAGS